MVGVNTKEMHGSNYGFVAQVRNLEEAFIENASLTSDGPLGCVTFGELVDGDAIRVDDYVPKARSAVPSGRIVHLPMLPSPQEIDVDAGLYF